MKTAKILALSAAMALLAGMSAEVAGQGFLDRLGKRLGQRAEEAITRKAEQAVDGAIDTATDADTYRGDGSDNDRDQRGQRDRRSSQQQLPAGQMEQMQSMMGAFGLDASALEQMGQMGGQGGMGGFGQGGDQSAPERINPSQLVKKRLQTTASWDGVVTPSSASTLNGLIGDLPGLPSVSDLVHPDATKREAYYKKIAAVNLRVEQLLKQQACTDGEMDAFLAKLYAEQAAMYGLTEAELRSLDSGNISDAERDRLTQKMLEAMLGGSASGIMAIAEQSQASGGEISQEQAMAMLGQLNLGDLMAAGQKMQAMMERQNRLYQSMYQVNQMMGAVTGAINSAAHYQAIAGKYDGQLSQMYTDLCRASSPGAIDAIYSRADALVREYRTEAATAWLADLQDQMQKLAQAYPSMLQMEADMVAEGLMAPCSQRTSSFNIVSLFANILDQAYRDFPQTDMLPVCREVILRLPDNESLYVSESAIATTVDGFLSGSNIMTYDSASGVHYVYENGVKRVLGADEQRNLANRAQGPKPTYGHWTSDNGLRSLDYQQDGALMLHDGTIFYPLAFEVNGKVFTWITQIGNSLEKCTYRL